MNFTGKLKLIFYFFIKEERGGKKSIFKSREDNWLSIKTTLDFVPTSVTAGDERQFKLGSCSNIIPSSCHLGTQSPKIIENCRRTVPIKNSLQINILTRNWDLGEKNNWKKRIEMLENTQHIKCFHLLNKHTVNHELNSLDWCQSLLPKLLFFLSRPGYSLCHERSAICSTQ